MLDCYWEVTDLIWEERFSGSGCVRRSCGTTLPLLLAKLFLHPKR
jgi:hypothetical protein